MTAWPSARCRGSRPSACSTSARRASAWHRAMRLGWMLIPSWLAWQLISAKAIEDGGSEVVGQLALCDFIERGELDRHVRRMRLRYQAATRRAARRARAAGCRRDARAAPRRAVRAGASCPSEVDEPALLAAAAARGVGMEGLRWHRFTHGGPPGVVLGYGNLSEPAIEQGVRLLAEALAERRCAHRGLRIALSTPVRVAIGTRVRRPTGPPRAAHRGHIVRSRAKRLPADRRRRVAERRSLRRRRWASPHSPSFSSPWRCSWRLAPHGFYTARRPVRRLQRPLHPRRRELLRQRSASASLSPSRSPRLARAGAGADGASSTPCTASTTWSTSPRPIRRGTATSTSSRWPPPRCCSPGCAAQRCARGSDAHEGVRGGSHWRDRATAAAALAAVGHEPTAMTRSPEKAEALRGTRDRDGRRDAFDAPGLARAVVDARPEQ